MKKSLSLVFATLLFVALGCSFGGFGKKEEAPTPAPDSTSSDSNSSDTKNTSEKPIDSTSSESGSLTLSNFDKIELGATYEDVVKILGSDGSETSSSSIGGSERKSYKWEGEKFMRIYANFKDNKVISKNQSGLGDKNADLTKAKYDEIKTGMSYSEVKGVIGSDGAMTSQSKIGNTELTRYRWSGDKYSSISASFKDDKMSSKSQSNVK